MLDLEQLYILLGILATLFSVGFGVYRSTKWIARWHRNRIRRQEQDSELRQTVLEIYKQLKPNGGSSLRDSVDNIESRIYRLEEQLSLSNQVSQLILLDAGLAVFHTDEQGQFTNVNRTFQVLAGRAEEELKGMGWIQCVKEEEQEQVIEQWMQSIRFEHEFHKVFIIESTTGDEYPVSCKAFPLRQQNGELKGWMGFVRRLDDTSPACYKR